MSIFTKVKAVRPKKNAFNLSHSFAGALNMGEIVPCLVMHHILPGSSVTCNVSQLTRFQALLAPIMDNVDAYVHFWKIPYRLLDPKWTEFIGGTMMRNGIEGEYNPPYFTLKGLLDATVTPQDLGNVAVYCRPGHILDYLGYPTKPDGDTGAYFRSTVKMSTRPLQFYTRLIWERYRNQNIALDEDLSECLQFFSQVPEGIQASGLLEGDVSEIVFNLLKLLHAMSPSACFPHEWQRDYYTSALPFVQLGDEVEVPLGGTASVTIDGDGQTLQIGGYRFSSSDEKTIKGQLYNPENAGEQGILTSNITEFPNGVDDIIDYNTSTPLTRLLGTLESDLVGTADLSEAKAVSINELRVLNALQSLKESMARFGTKYDEYAYGFFGSKISDARLQRTEFLGGGRIPVNISDIEQTSASEDSSLTGATTPQGNLAGKAVGMAQFRGFTTYCEEDSMIMGVLYIAPKPSYACLGINKMLTKLNDRFDFFNPKIEHLGEQEVKNYELFISGDNDVDNSVFGYQARFAEYKFMPNEIHGEFKSSMAFYHFARIFNSTPTLSPEFIYMNKDELSRPFAVQTIEDEDGHEIPVQQTLHWIYFNLKMVAPMSKFGVPMLLA